MKIKFKPVCAVPAETLERRRQYLRGKYPPPPEARHPTLAVVGGGPSAAARVTEIRQFPHHAIWAINGTWRWLQDLGIECTGFTLDSLFDDFAPTTIFGDGCDPGKIRTCLFPHVADLTDVVRGTTTATAAPILAARLGYGQVNFYGCEGSFTDGQTHTFKTIEGERVWVQCNGREYETNPQMFMQSEVLAHFIRLAPNTFKDRSGGLLAAMVKDPDPDFTHASPQLHGAVMKSLEADHGNLDLL